MQINEIAIKLNESVALALGDQAINGFQKAFLISTAISDLKELLTVDVMKPIMQLQSNRLGFKTDKDTSGGYSLEVVKNCMIEAVLFGMQPYGNQFNIIAGNMYATKEGLGYLLSNFNGLSYNIVADLPRIKEESAAVVMTIKWTLSGISNEQKIDIPIKVNKFMGTDAILGKATRKARKWLYDTITGSEIPEGDTADTFADTKLVSSQLHTIAFEDLQELFELKKDLLTLDEVNNAERIINNKEDKSYQKLQTLLSQK